VPLVSRFKCDARSPQVVPSMWAAEINLDLVDHLALFPLVQTQVPRRRSRILSACVLPVLATHVDHNGPSNGKKTSGSPVQCSTFSPLPDLPISSNCTSSLQHHLTSLSPPSMYVDAFWAIRLHQSLAREVSKPLPRPLPAQASTPVLVAWLCVSCCYDRC